MHVRDWKPTHRLTWTAGGAVETEDVMLVDGCGITRMDCLRDWPPSWVLEPRDIGAEWTYDGERVEIVRVEALS